MQRDLSALSNNTFDLLVIGGGMHGACIAWEAVLRGLSVALVEQADFASATSANSLKVIHGGLRYLQSADFRRMRQSIKARQTLMKVAPHLVHPLPVVVPTYGHSIKGKEAMSVALLANDVISCDRNLSLSDPQKHIPTGQILSKADCLKILPDLPQKGLTGAARFYDAQAYNSEQLVLAFIQSAAERGAKVANYTRVTGFETAQGRVTAANVTDQLTGDSFSIQAKATINASGPWVGQLIASATNDTVKPQPLGKAMNLVTRPLFGAQQDCAVGITSQEPGSRLFFIAPWRGRSLVGTWYGTDKTGAKPPTVESDEVQDFLDDVNQAYPTLNLTQQDVEWVHVGLLPSSGTDDKTGEVQLDSHFTLQDHKSDGLGGLLSVTGVKYTTAQDIAQKVLDWAFKDLGQLSPKTTSSKVRLQGGNIDRFDDFLTTATAEHSNIPANTIKRLVYNYGSRYLNVLKHIDVEQPSTTEVTDHEVFTAEVHYHLANTMPQTLSDIVFRRTELGAAGHPGKEVLTLCVQVMSKALGWSEQKQTDELNAVQQQFNSRSWNNKSASQATSQQDNLVGSTA